MGAAVGEAVAGKKEGWKAPLWGGICGTIPDLDVISSTFMHVVESNQFHRTITHSIPFFIIMAPLLGYLIHRLHSSGPATFKDWTILAFLALFTHALLDCFTTWPTLLFWPLQIKVAWKSIFVIDPLYTIPLATGLIAAMFYRKDRQIRRKLNYAGIVISSAYLLFTVLNKQHINDVFRKALDEQNLAVTRMDTRPSPLNNILWVVNAESPEGYYIGYYSIFDPNIPQEFEFHPKNHGLLEEVPHTLLLEKLVDLSDGWYTLREQAPGHLIFNDLRFGTNKGWEPGGEFIFSYDLEKQGSELLISEKGRTFDDSPGQILSGLFNRMFARSNTGG